MRGGKFAHSQVRDHLISSLNFLKDEVIWVNSLINVVHSGSRAWPCLAVPSAQTPFAPALSELSFHAISMHGKGRDKGLIGCVGERIWWCGLSPSAPAAQPQPAPAVLFCTVHSGWKPSQQNGREHLMGHKWQLWPRTHPRNCPHKLNFRALQSPDGV